MLTLHELSDAYNFLIEQSDLSEEQLLETLGKISDQIRDKVENIGKIILTINSNIKVIEKEEERLALRRQVMANKATWLKNYLLQEMTSANIDRVERDIITVAIRTNPASVNVDDEQAIPEEYRRIIPETWQPDKKQILEHFKDTGEVVPGVSMITDKKRVEIK